MEFNPLFTNTQQGIPSSKMTGDTFNCTPNRCATCHQSDLCRKYRRDIPPKCLIILPHTAI